MAQIGRMYHPAPLGFCLIVLSLSRINYIEATLLPTEWWGGTTISRHILQSPTLVAFPILEGVAVASLAMLAAGCFTRAATLTFLFAFGWLQFTAESLRVLPGAAWFPVAFWIPLIFAFSRWGDFFSVDACHAAQPISGSSGEYRAPFRVFLVYFGFLMFTAGFYKVTGSWLTDWGTLEKLFAWKPKVSAVSNGVQHLITLPDIAFSRREGFAVSQAVTLIYELSFPLAVFSRRVKWLYLAVLPFFNAANQLILGIPVPSMLVMYVVLLRACTFHYLGEM